MLVYIGQTKRSLKNTIDEHKKCTNPDSVIVTHIKKYKHSFDWQNVNIVDREINYNNA